MFEMPADCEYALTAWCGLSDMGHIQPADIPR